MPCYPKKFDLDAILLDVSQHPDLTKKQEETHITAPAVAMEDPFTDCKQEETHITADAITRIDVYYC